jgi:eukaryotic-like serine/threonine-protein kinase
MLTPETVLQGRYRVVRQLGQGGMGAVYEAIDERLDTTVALKETLFGDERLRKQFEREARLLARMHHPALPRVSDHFSEADGQFLVMQFIAGDDLAQMMKDKQGPFPPDQVLRWGDQLLDALDYLHTQEPQIIHRDIKPQNLKLTSRGQIILLDFGLAKGETAGLSAVTTSASIYGYTPNYAPLEQIQGQGTDPRSDIYALSATLYHLMTGVKPPDALTRAAAMVNGQADPLVPANQISGAIGPEVASVLMRGMSQNRTQRYASAAGMRAALKGTEEVVTLAGKAEAATILFQQPDVTQVDPAGPTVRSTAARTGETTVVQQLPPTRRRTSAWAAGIAAVILIGAIFGVFYAYQRRNRTTTQQPPDNAAEAQSPIVPEPAATSTTSTQPLVEPVTEETKTAATNQRTEVPKKTDKVKETNKSAQAPVPGHNTPPTPVTDFDKFPFPQNSPDTTNPDTNTNELSGARRRNRLGPIIRNLPDGSKVITNPDGSRILVNPNGTTRLLRPGERFFRRKAANYR